MKSSLVEAIRNENKKKKLERNYNTWNETMRMDWNLCWRHCLDVVLNNWYDLCIYICICVIKLIVSIQIESHAPYNNWTKQQQQQKQFYRANETEHIFIKSIYKWRWISVFFFFSHIESNSVLSILTKKNMHSPPQICTKFVDCVT